MADLVAAGTATQRFAPVAVRRRPPGAAFLCWYVAVFVLCERLALPLGGTSQLPLSIPLMLGMTVLGLRFGHLVLSPWRGLLLGVAVTAIGLLTLLSEVRDQHPSILSLLLFLLIYLPASTVARAREAAAYALRFFVDLMLVASVAGIGLFLTQFAGVAYVDRLGQVVPASFLQQGFNTGDPITYGSAIYRSNGTVFLEPSFFSLFLGLAVVISLSLRHHRVGIVLLLGAIVTTEAGNGIVVILASVLWVLLVGPQRRRLLVLAPPLVLAVAFAALTPLGALFLHRSSEVGSTGSSSSLRFVQPYQDLIPAYVSSTSSALVGNGAGSAQRLTDALHGDLPVIVPVLPKLLYEYGALGALAVGALLIFLAVADGRRVEWFAGLTVAFFFLNASLLQATLAGVTWMFLSTLAPRVDPEPVRISRSRTSGGPARHL